MTRDIKAELSTILMDYCTVSDSWGGSKLASWQWGESVCVSGIDEAVEAILRVFNVEAKAQDYSKEI